MLRPLSIVTLVKITFLTVSTAETLSLRFRGDSLLLQEKINSVFTTDKVFPQEVWPH